MPEDYDDELWEGPQAPEFSEVDFEAFDEMVRDDLRGAEPTLTVDNYCHEGATWSANPADNV